MTTLHCLARAHTQTSRETCGDCEGRGAVAWVGGRVTCDELERQRNKQGYGNLKPRGTPPLHHWVAEGICECPERPDLDINDPVLFLDFVVTHTFCVPEDPASLRSSKLPRQCQLIRAECPSNGS